MVTEHGLRPRDVLRQTHEQLNAVLLYVWSVFGVLKDADQTETQGTSRPYMSMVSTTGVV